MPWFRKYFLQDKAGEGGAGGGAGGAGAPDPAKELADLKEKLAAQEKELATLKAPKPDPKDADDLARKAQIEREEAEKKAAESKHLETALKFNLGATEWLKTNATLLPKTVEGIFAQAEKENYGSAIEKSSAIKVGVISEFFAQASNMELLTPTLKQTLEDFQKLTKTVKQERVQSIYDTVFEPTLESLRKIKKAEALKSGLAEPTGSEDAYKQKMIKFSKEHYLRENK